MQDISLRVIVLLRLAAGIRLQMFDLTRGEYAVRVCVHECVHVFVSDFPSASCRVSCWLSGTLLTLSSDCFLSAVPDRK